MANEITVPEAPIADAPTTQIVRPRRVRRGRQLIRLHAIEGELAKIYPIDDRRFGHGLLGRVADLRRVSNIYFEGSRLAQRVSGGRQTVLHSIVSEER